jgi:hypothetical protein
MNEFARHKQKRTKNYTIRKRAAADGGCSHSIQITASPNCHEAAGATPILDATLPMPGSAAFDTRPSHQVHMTHESYAPAPKVAE